MDIIKFREAVERAWSKDTSYSPDDYDYNDVAYGQCAITALLFFEKFGGEVKKGLVVRDKTKSSHYWNFLNGVDIDLTWRQFPVGSVLTNITTLEKNPKSLLKDSKFRNRYNLLKARFDGI